MAVRADLDGFRLDGSPLMRLGSWTHLAGRFFAVATAAPLTTDERREVEGWLLGAGESALYWEQPVSDQRHGLEAARRVAAVDSERRDLVRAGLLHDIGKRHSGLGLVGRSLASAATKLRIPVSGSWERYLEHGTLGAEELARLGAEWIVIEFTRHHHGARPSGIARDDWEVLRRADR